VSPSPRAGMESSGSPKRLLVAVTNSPQTDDLLRLAQAIASPGNAIVWAIHVLSGSNGDGRGTQRMGKERLHRLEEAEAWLAKRLRRIDGLAERTRIIVVVGTPSQEILSTAKSLEADLILMAAGTNPKRPTRSMGPVTARVTAGAPCSVLVARSQSRPGP
jgi:nucleotide-binding universal stress UspA family protein